MNANDIANKLDMGNYDWADVASLLLRQQQTQIEDLQRMVKTRDELIKLLSENQK
jgi:hypothetical protein